MNNDAEKAALADILSFVTELLVTAQMKKGLDENDEFQDLKNSGQLEQGASADLMMQAGASPEDAMSPVGDNAAAGLAGNKELANTARSGQLKQGSFKSVMDQMIAEAPGEDDEDEEK